MIDNEYNQKFIKPWQLTKNQTNKNKLLWGFNHFKNKKGYAENKQKYKGKWLEKLKSNANSNTYPNLIKKGITIHTANLRALPTEKPFYKNFDNEGEGYPFDKIQITSIPIGTPLFLEHQSIDGEWIFVQSTLASGWIKIRDIAFCSDQFIKSYKNNKGYIAIIDENIPIKNKSKRFIFKANIGNIFPLIRVGKYNYAIKVPVKNSNQFAMLKEVYLKKKYGTIKPYKITLENLIKQSNKLIKQPYGWGGLYNNRDCSSLIRDLFTPFGIWLPRNSKYQASTMGTQLDISMLNNSQKEKFIIDNAPPYLTLLWFPGHIMLYIGHKENKAFIFHNIWGLKTKDKSKRKLIGKSIISDLNIGINQNNIKKDTIILNRIKTMTLIGPYLK